MNQRRAELNAMREKKSPNARQKYRVSRLYRYRHDLVALRECGASYGEIREWLKQYKKVTVATSTVLRFLASLQGKSSNPVARDE